mgnify:CR=1 FL=1
MKSPCIRITDAVVGGRSPCGERGLKFMQQDVTLLKSGRSPCGERGLKYNVITNNQIRVLVAPRAGSVD